MKTHLADGCGRATIANSAADADVTCAFCLRILAARPIDAEPFEIGPARPLSEVRGVSELDETGRRAIDGTLPDAPRWTSDHAAMRFALERRDDGPSVRSSAHPSRFNRVQTSARLSVIDGREDVAEVFLAVERAFPRPFDHGEHTVSAADLRTALEHVLAGPPEVRRVWGRKSTYTSRRDDAPSESRIAESIAARLDADHRFTAALTKRLKRGRQVFRDTLTRKRLLAAGGIPADALVGWVAIAEALGCTSATVARWSTDASLEMPIERVGRRVWANEAALMSWWDRATAMQVVSGDSGKRARAIAVLMSREVA